MTSEIKMEASLLMDRKYWLKQKVNNQRPLQKIKNKALFHGSVYESVRQQQALETLGEARDLIGAELRERLRESGHG